MLGFGTFHCRLCSRTIALNPRNLLREIRHQTLLLHLVRKVHKTFQSLCLQLILSSSPLEGHNGHNLKMIHAETSTSTISFPMSQCVHVIKTCQHTHANTKGILMLQESVTVDGALAGALGSFFTFFFSAHGGSSPWLSLFMSTSEICAIVPFYMIMPLACPLTFPLRLVS